MIDEHDLPKVVDLAREDDFALGSLRVQPSVCQTRFGSQTRHLEPRVMQVLVALVQARGAVVSRDVLISRCWGGRIVGEDAINRTLLKLRTLAREEGGSFAIETIPRVGYRLKTVTGPTSGLQPNATGIGSTGPPRMLEARRVILVSAVVGTIIMAAMLAALAWQARAPGNWEVGDYEIVVSGGAGSPDLTADGRFLVYHQPGQDGSSDIWMRGVRDGEPVRVVGGPDEDLSPVWSPRGDQIAFVRMARDTSRSSPCRIYVKAIPDGLERLVGRCVQQPWTGRLAWAPAGDALLFSESVEFTGLAARIRRLDLRTGKRSDLTQPPVSIVGDRGAVLSPDGRSLAFVRYGANEVADVFIQDLRTGRLTQVTHDQAQADVEWSSDGRSLFIASRRRGPSELWAFDPRGRSEPQRLLVGLQEVLRPSAAPGMVAFTTNSRAQEIIRLSNGVETPVASGSHYLSVDVSPDGVIAFISQDPVARLWLQPPGQPARRLRDLGVAAPRYLAFAPDGARLSLIGERDNDSDIYVVEVASGAMSRIRSPRMNVSRATWTADGKNLIRSGSDGRTGGIARLEGMSEARRTGLTDVGWPLSQASSEGVFGERVRAPDVWRIVPGGKPVVVAPRKMHQLWRVAGGAVYVLDDTDPNRNVLLRHPLSGGPPTEAAAGLIADFAVDPRNGDLILVLDRQLRQDIGLLKLNRR